MDIKKLTIGTIAGAVVFFLLGWLVYGYLLRNFMGHNPGAIGLVGRTEINFVFLGLGHVAQALLLTYILLKSNSNSLGGGLTTGALVGFLMGVASDCMMYGTTIVISKKGMAADVIAFTVICAVTGAVIGVLTAKKN
ncbi:MAG: hypothetical protein IPP72_19875 [Chitinophagaceae bacterium]|nr:hypothetical protein [Chitinophagaceae bacterium]